MNFRNLRGRVGKLFVSGAIATMLFSMTSCDEATTQAVFDILEALLDCMGYIPQNEDVDDETTDDVDNDDSGLPSSVDWTKYAPTVGNQGSYGTCVAWATGYGLKTTLNNIEHNYTNYRNTASYQTSPIDLWYLMRTYTSGTSQQCGGSSFDPAFKVMIDKGVASMSAKPFTGQKMDCDNGTPSGNTGNKLGAYRLVAYTNELAKSGPYGMSVANLKSKLNEGPLVVGAKLGETFMRWNSSAVITSDDPASYNGGHAYHAMMIVGYDDSRKAFRIQNSWGTTEWGDNGYIWVGYDHFIKNFAFGVWSASNDANAYSSSTAATRGITGVDLKLEVIADEALANGNRKLTYDIVNKGTGDVNLSNSNVVYSLYKKKHFHEKSILADVKVDAVLPAGAKVSSVLGKQLTIEYQLPSVFCNGELTDAECYMFLALDPKNESGDDNLENNFAFITSSDAKPLKVFNNEITNDVKILTADLSTKITNDYTGSELIGRLAKELK
jgi:C1A family cysteine protease